MFAQTFAVESKPSIFKRIADAVTGRSIFVSSTASLRTNYVRLYGEGYKWGSDALEVAAVYACVSKIADTIASLEASVVRVGKDGSREVIDSHPVHNLISRTPNEHINAYDFWQLIVSDALLHGCGYAFIDRTNGEMFYVPAVRVSYTIDQHTGKKYYSYDGAPGPVPARDMLEIHAFRGLNPTHIQMQNFTTAKAIQDFGAKFFENGGMMGGILATKEHMSPEQISQAQEMWDASTWADTTHTRLPSWAAASSTSLSLCLWTKSNSCKPRSTRLRRLLVSIRCHQP